MKRRICTLIISSVLATGMISAYGNKETTDKTVYRIEKISTPTIKIGDRIYKAGDSFLAGEVIHWTDADQWMLVVNTETSRREQYSKRTSEKKGFLQSILDFFLVRTKGSTRGVHDYIQVESSDNQLSYPERRIALVVGIQNYTHMAPLKSAQKDAETISDALSALGFDVIELYDSDDSELQSGMNKFAGSAGKYDVALVYFAGHGIQDGAVNYLLPVNYNPEEKEKRRNDRVSCNDIVERIENSGCQSRVFFFDACRERNGEASGEYNKIVMEGKPGSVILFATQSGGEAIDGDWDSNSPFASSLIQNINRTASFSDVMDGLVRDTYYSTGRRQYPVKVGSLLADFQFTHKPKNEVTVELPLDGGNVTNGGEEVGNDMTANELFQKGEDFYEGKNGVGKNPVEAIRWYELAARRGHEEAMYSLGYMHSHGEGTSTNKKKACEWHEKAAKKGFAKSQYVLGWTYANGDGVPKNEKRAVEMYTAAADKGHVGAQYELGCLHMRESDGRSANFKEAARYFGMAAIQGYDKAKVCLGDLYLQGKGVDRDYEKALELYGDAAAHGLSDAICNLGYMYENGLGVDQDSDKAYELYYKAAREGNAGAKYNLGVMYENGISVPRNIKEAKKWYNLASQQGEERAKKALERLKWNN